jgi:F-type H+-transporting ATPase subunit delta
MAKLSSNYASALFELILQESKPEDILPQAEVLRDTLMDTQCRRVLVHPHISSDEKRGFFDAAFSGKLNVHLLSFLRLVIDKNRETFAAPALNELIGLIHAHLGITTAKVTAPSPLSAKQTGELKKVLEEKLDKKVLIDIKTNPAVIGAVGVQADGYFFDQTVRRRMQKLTEKLYEEERCGA